MALIQTLFQALSTNPGSTAGVGFSRWPVMLVITAALLMLPIIIIAASLALPFSDTWRHLLDTVIVDYLGTSALLMLGVGAGTAVLGVGAAWLTTAYQFPGRSALVWALLLPMAMPAYIIAYTYTGLLDFSGPVQSALRDNFGWGYGDYYFPQIRSLGGAIAMLSLVLYPYVYLLARVAFMEQSASMREAARSLGRSPTQVFFRVALPQARPAIVAGVSLALMETLADFGTVDYFGVSAFTTGIFRTWYGMGELTTAAQLSALLMLFILVLIVVERTSRARMRYHQSQRRAQRTQLSGWRSALCCGALVLIVLAGFLVPAMQLLMWAINHWRGAWDDQFLQLVWNSFSLASITAVVCLGLSLLLAYGQRLSPGLIERSAVRLAALGYAVPGMVIAVGVLIPLAWLDNRVDALAREWFDTSTGLLLSGTLLALVFAYAVRFLSVSLQSVESGLSRVKPTLDDAASTLGASAGTTLRRVHLPILRGSLLTALLLVFVDVLKELPATLILRPFNFNTLAVRTYELASDERLTDAALPALAIVIIGLIPVILLIRAIAEGEKQHG